MKVTLNGKITGTETIPFISHSGCEKGITLSNERGEHFVFAIEVKRMCCEEFDYKLPTLLPDYPDGCEIEVIDKLHVNKERMKDLSNPLNADLQNIVAIGFYPSSYNYGKVIIIKIKDNRSNIVEYGYVSNIHNGYYSHNVVYGDNGELVWKTV